MTPVDKTWRHLDFFEHQAYLSARVPRVRCAVHGVHLVNAPWARPGSGFTLLFEVAMLTYAKQMPIAALASMAREHDTRIWPVVEHHVHAARARLDFSAVTDVGMDETSARRGQDYVSIFMDLDARAVMFTTEGRDAVTVGAFAADLSEHGADMSPALFKGITTHLDPGPPPADRVRPLPRGGQGQRGRRHRSAGRGENPPGAQGQPVRLAEERGEPDRQTAIEAGLADPALDAAEDHPGRALARRLPRLLRPAHPASAEAYRRWCYGAKRSRLEPIKQFVATVERHWDGILAWQRNRLSNALLEATNELIQAAKRRARGYRTTTKMITIIYLTTGKLPLPQIHPI